jgi:hypothetical protein
VCQVVPKVPDVQVAPAPNQKFNLKLSPLSLFNVPVVSPGKVAVLNSQVSVTSTV